ncbi:hypothetical protein [Anaerovorax sp. IOR16]|uniref:hypothetical protein n=1 Tax=Anaerovorax sp. IOR16 TaxID=2773458 RepID=UPI0019D2218B|nr:hypothetical protein [Anaerovorax sp. IOR16]
MGKSKSYEVIEYRDLIKKYLLESDSICELLGNTESPQSLWHNAIYPYEFIPDTTETKKSFINFELRTDSDVMNPTYKTVTIWFFISTHIDNLVDSTSLWYDRVVCVLDNLIAQENVLGINEVKLISNAPYTLADNFKGRILIFKAKDYYDGKKNGK